VPGGAFEALQVRYNQLLNQVAYPALHTQCKAFVGWMDQISPE
jgi:hypothetical protein